MPAVVVSRAVGRWLRLHPSEKADDYLPFTLDQIDAMWQGWQRDWAARTGAVHVLAHSAGHCVHEDAPALAALAVDAVVRAAQASTRVEFDAAELDAAGGQLVDVQQT